MLNTLTPQDIKEIDDLRNQISSLQETLELLIKDHLVDAFEEFFKEYGDLIESITWQQFTPYWADGDPTEFGIRGLNVTFLDTQQNYEILKLRDEIDIRIDNSFSIHGFPTIKYESFNSDVTYIWGFINDYYESMEHIFGDHQEVTVTKEGISTTEIDHY